MKDLKYEDIEPVNRSEAESIFANGDEYKIARTLISIGLYDDDWKWVQQQALFFLLHRSVVVVSAAILSIAHAARNHGTIDLEIVVPALRKVAADDRYTGKAQDALDDIEMFVHAEQNP